MRRIKSLKLNGVIVGEYLGSDDVDEDIKAARDMLTALGHKPPSLAQAMLTQANAFAHTANRIYMQDLRSTASEHKIVGAAPFVVNAAFSIEIYLKTLQLVTSGSSKRGHKLLKLFDVLPGSKRVELCDDASKLAAQHGESSDVNFRDLLTMLDDAFEQWRYVYEVPRSRSIHFQQAILVMHTCRDVCVRVIK